MATQDYFGAKDTFDTGSGKAPGGSGRAAPRPPPGASSPGRSTAERSW